MYKGLRFFRCWRVPFPKALKVCILGTADLWVCKVFRHAQILFKRGFTVVL